MGRHRDRSPDRYSGHDGDTGLRGTPACLAPDPREWCGECEGGEAQHPEGRADGEAGLRGVDQGRGADLHDGDRRVHGL
ncbi:hypothetical protein [Sphaerimonospora mesophila]|uniref:hypothetical protein n=1 Tax=Sphaerimonospora mesophila TaxID=37483 RepID=UPI00128EAC5D